jgi:hypothetical protein
MEKPTQTTQELLLEQKEAKGPVWARLVLEKIQGEFVKASQIVFYGARSKVLFGRRTRAIDQFVGVAKSYLDGADVETRVYLLHMLSETYKKMASDILKTPLPEGLDEETLQTVHAQLAEMAAPFETVQKDYENLLNGQLATIADEAKRTQVSSHLASDIPSYANLIALENRAAPQIAIVDEGVTKSLREKLAIAPEDRGTLSQLRNFYQKGESLRLASYYTGRLDTIKEVKP